MAQDGLAEINGIKPNVLLADGEEHEVGSTTSKSKYKVKRTADHYHCTCPAWRNQAGVPVDARTCKHLKSYLGEDYENARIAWKNPDGPPPKGSKSKPKASTKRKRAGADEVDEEEDKPAKKKASTSRASKRAKAASKRAKAEPEEEENAEMTPVAEVVESALNQALAGDDELAEINGVKPLVALRDGEEREVGSATSKSKYKIKRTFDHYYWFVHPYFDHTRLIVIHLKARVPVNARTCKHLKSLLGDVYEEARLALKNSDTSTRAKPTSKAKPASKAKQAAKKAKAEDEDVIMDAQEAEAGNDKDNDAVKEEEEEHDDTAEQADAVDGDDELKEINGTKPNVYMKDGEEREVGSLSSNAKYKIKRTWDHYYCSCPAWRNQVCRVVYVFWSLLPLSAILTGAPVNARTCKHLKLLLGESYELARIQSKNPDGPQPTTTAKASRGKARRNAGNGGDEGDETVAMEKLVPELLLANKWDIETGVDPTGWWISEKLDGVRTYYDGKRMVSRLGNAFTPPQWFLDKLPKDVTLDGELFSGRGEFQSTVSIVKTVNSPHWKNITFQVFDIPSRGTEPFESRMSYLQTTLFGPSGSHHDEKFIKVVEQEQARDRQHVLDRLKEIESLGGEGVMLRRPGSVYEGCRSSSLLKLKTFYDAEAVVVGYVEGKGKNKGVTGALKCKMESGKTFSVGSGFQELTRDRVPRFPTFVGVAVDKDVPKDADVPERKVAGEGGDV
ncbi:DNA ligase [Leucoagaricus sp. SymC.cos]|nr:DNA ligase [Leucoagaricus sp. SymC.cos]